MSGLGIVAVLVGTLIVVTRAPLVFAPQATLNGFERIIRSDSAVRGLGAMLAPLGVALILLSRGEGLVVVVLAVLGWLFTPAALWLIASPTTYRRVAIGALEFFRSSVDPAVMRGLGMLAVGLGAALIYAGLVVL